MRCTVVTGGQEAYLPWQQQNPLIPPVVASVTAYISILLCFDCDGTLDCSGGPVKVSRLIELQINGVYIAIVSPSPACASLHFPHVIDGASRKDCLLKAKGKFPAALCIYVSDNPGDDAVAAEAGFAFMHPKDFR